MRLLILLSGLFLLSFNAHALDYKAEYKAYNAAIEAGDEAEAIKRAEAAWQAAETELGDNQTTAILAYNYASLIYDKQPEKTTAAINRVMALTGSPKCMPKNGRKRYSPFCLKRKLLP